MDRNSHSMAPQLVAAGLLVASTAAAAQGGRPVAIAALGVAVAAAASLRPLMCPWQGEDRPSLGVP